VIGAGPDSWPATIRNVSQGGILLQVSRRFEARTLLQIELRHPIGDVPRTFLVRVAHVSSLDDGTWGLGCTFPRELAESEIQCILDAAGP
jgi:hypothetical protein